jgi:general secretion pathway protein J
MTLIELMISMAILAFMMVIAWSALHQTTTAKKTSEGVQDRYRELRQAMAVMERDLTMAYLSSNEDPLAPERRTKFSADAAGGEDRLVFSTLSHTRFYADAAESDQTVVAYFLAEDPDQPTRRNLYRFESARTAAERWSQLPGESEVLVVDVVKFDLSFWHEKNADWVEEWDSTRADNQNRLPPRVRVQLTFKDEKEREVNVQTQVAIPLREVVQAYAN